MRILLKIIPHVRILACNNKFKFLRGKWIIRENWLVSVVHRISCCLNFCKKRMLTWISVCCCSYLCRIAVCIMHYYSRGPFGFNLELTICNKRFFNGIWIQNISSVLGWVSTKFRIRERPEIQVWIQDGRQSRRFLPAKYFNKYVMKISLKIHV